MKVFLLNPPFPLFFGETKFASPPLGLAYIAAYLEQNGHDVAICDAVVEGYHQERKLNGVLVYGLDTHEIIDRIKAFNPDVVGVSCVFSTLHSIVLDLCAAVKDVFENVKIVLGGVHATIFAEDLVRCQGVDFVVRGEGEYAFKELLEYLQGRRKSEEVCNLTWKLGGSFFSNPQVFIENIDSLPFPARHLLNMRAYDAIGKLQGVVKKGEKATTVITSRGCPASCIFCSIHSVWGHKFRAHSFEYVLSELKLLKERFGINHIVFEDDNITFDKKRAAQIFKQMIDGRFNFTWSAPNGVAAWCLDEELLMLMKQSGCLVLFLALESGCSDTLSHIIRKPLNLDKSLEILRLCRKIKIRTQAFFVVGFPGETQETMKLSMAFAEKLDVDRISIAIATPYPGTKLFDICKKEGYLRDDFDMTRLMTRYGQIYTQDFSPKDVERLAGKTYLRFAFFHPIKTLMHLLERLQSDPLQTIKFVFKRLISIR